MPWLVQQSTELERAVLKRDDDDIRETVETIRAHWDAILAAAAPYILPV